MKIQQTKEDDLYEKMYLDTQLAFESKNLNNYKGYLQAVLDTANTLIHEETIDISRFIQTFRQSMDLVSYKYTDFL